MSNVAAMVRQSKERHPEQFCAVPRCLWRIKGHDGSPRTPCAKHMAAEPNQFEAGGRRVKVAKMLAIADSVIALMPAGTTDEQAAERFRRFRQEDRARVALLAAVKVPSDESWRAFCDAVRDRGAEPLPEEQPECSTCGPVCHCGEDDPWAGMCPGCGGSCQTACR